MKESWYDRVVGWAEDRNLIEGSTPVKQLKKLYEELGELLTAIGDSDDAEIEDGIGDVCVVLAIISKQLGHTPRWRNGQNILAFPLLVALHEIGELSIHVIDGSDFSIPKIDAAFACMRSVADDNILNYEDCLERSWNQIKDRRGKMENGVFVKEA